MHALEPPAQDDLLLRAARQLTSVPVGQDCTECHHLGRLSEHPPFRSPTAKPERGQATKAWQQDIVACIEVGKKALSQAVGGDKCNAACQRRSRHARIDHTTIDQHAPTRRTPRTENCFQDLRPTRAKGAEEAYHLAGSNPQTNRAETCADQVLESQDWSGGSQLVPRGRCDRLPSDRIDDGRRLETCHVLTPRGRPSRL